MMIGVVSDSGWVRSTTSTEPPASDSISAPRVLLENGSDICSSSGLGMGFGRPKRPGELEPVLQQVQVHVEALRTEGIDLGHDARQVISGEALSYCLGEFVDLGHGGRVPDPGAPGDRREVGPGRGGGWEAAYGQQRLVVEHDVRQV